jgi:IS30 family transposase
MTTPIKTGKNASRFNLTPARIEIICRASRAGCSLHQIAMLLGVSDTTISSWIKRDDVCKIYQLAKLNAVIEISEMLYTLAQAGDLGAIIFYLKTRGGWSAEKTVELAQEDSVVIYLPDNGRDSAPVQIIDI